MNILYLSCHAILEADEIKLFTDLGHNVFSMGAYQVSNADNNLRPAIPGLYNNEHLRAVSLHCSKENLHQELIDWMDICVMMHNSKVDVHDHPQPWLANNWQRMKHKPVVWRSIGQSSGQIEEALKEFKDDGLKVVRYSPMEETIPGYVGADAMIRFYKDPDEYKDYNGTVSKIVNVSQALFGGPQAASRGDHMDLDLFKKVVEGLDWKVFGPDNENAGERNGGMLSFTDLKQMLRYNRVYFYTGTRPASYTLALIEAMMTGIPIVSVGPEHGNSVYTSQKTFEVHEIIGEIGQAGFWSDNIESLREFCQRLLEDKELALQIGYHGRMRAIELFGKKNISEKWREFFDELEK